MYELLQDLTIMMLQEGLDEPSIHRVLDIVEGVLIHAEKKFPKKAEEAPVNNVVHSEKKFEDRKELAKKSPKYVKKNKIEAKDDRPVYKTVVQKAEDRFKEQGKKPSDPNVKSDPIKDVIPNKEVEAYRTMKDTALTVNNMMKSGKLDHVKQTKNGDLIGDAKTVHKLKDLKDKAVGAQMDLDRSIYKRTGRDAGYSLQG